MGTESWEDPSPQNGSRRRFELPRAAREHEFHLAVADNIYRAVEQCRYKPVVYVELFGRLGGVRGAQKLLAEPLCDDTLQLWARGRCDLAVETLAAAEEWKDLFSGKERAEAERRVAGWASAPAPDTIVATLLVGIGSSVASEPEEDPDWGK